MRKQALFLLFLLPLCAFSAEREITLATVGPAPGLRSGLRAAASANAVLAVWTDGRAATDETFGMLVGHDGEPLRERSFRIAAPPFGYGPVASDGRDFLVAGGIAFEEQLGFVLVRESGDVVPLPARVSGVNPSALVFTGSHYVLLHRTRKGHLACTILNPAGEVIREGVVITNDRLAPMDMRIAADGTGGMYVVWVRGDDYRPQGEAFTVAQLLAPDFVPVTTERVDAAIVPTADVEIAWNGGEYLLVWSIYGEKRLRRLDRQGQGIGGVMVLAGGEAPRVAWTGSNWLFAGYPGVHEAVRVSTTGAVLDVTPIRLRPHADSFQEAIAVNGGAWLGWDRRGLYPFSQFESDVVRPNGARRHAAGVLLSAGRPAQTSASLAACGDSTFAAVWTEQAERFVIRYARFSIDGQLLGPIVNVREAWTSAAVACNGGDAVVTWVEESNLFAAAIGGDYFALPPVRIDAARPSPAIAWNGEHYLVAFNRNQQLMLAQLDRAGQLTGAPLPMRELPSGTPYFRDESPVIVANGNNYFVSWLLATYDVAPGFGVFGERSFRDLRAIRLSPSLTRLSAVTEMARGSYDPIRSQGRPSLAAGPHGHLMAWIEGSNFKYTTRFARFDANGTLLDSPDGVILATGFAGAHAAWNGSAYEIASGDRLYTVAPDGTFTSRKGLVSGNAAALAFDGTRPLMLFTRPDPHDGVARLWVTDTTAPVIRRRASK